MYVAIIERLPYCMVVCVVGSLTLPLAIAVGYGFTVLIEEHSLRRAKKIVMLVADRALDLILSTVRARVTWAPVRRRIAEGD